MSHAGAIVRIDPHVQSEGSNDGREPVELFLEYTAAIEIDGVVITNHDTIDESTRAAELATEYRLVGIPGGEVSTRAGAPPRHRRRRVPAERSIVLRDR